MPMMIPTSNGGVNPPRIFIMANNLPQQQQQQLVNSLQQQQQQQQQQLGNNLQQQQQQQQIGMNLQQQQQLGNNLQQQQQQQQQIGINLQQQLTNNGVQDSSQNPTIGNFRPNFILAPTGFNGSPISINQAGNGTRLVRTASGLIELKNFRMPTGQRVILAPGSQIPAQKSFSDPSGLVQRTFNGVTLASGLKRTFPPPGMTQGIRLVNTSSLTMNSQPTFVTTTPTTVTLTPDMKLTSGAGNGGMQINASLLKTLQSINQTKLVSVEREKLLSVSKRAQLQK